MKLSIHEVSDIKTTTRHYENCNGFTCVTLAVTSKVAYGSDETIVDEISLFVPKGATLQSIITDESEEEIK